MENLLDRKAARERLGGVSDWTLRRLVKTGDLPVVRLGDRVLFRPEDLEQLVARSRTRRNGIEKVPT